MSWSVSIPKGTKEEVRAAVEAAELAQDTYNAPELIEQWGKQLKAAKAAALQILDAEDAFGGQGAYMVNLNGHAAHDGLAESSGYTPYEFVNVHVSFEPPQPQPA